MAIHHGLLHGVKLPILSREMLDRHDMGTMQGPDEANAGIDAFIAQGTADHPANKNRAGTAITFGTAFLGARQPPLQPQIIQKRVRRSEIA